MRGASPPSGEVRASRTDLRGGRLASFHVLTGMGQSRFQVRLYTSKRFFLLVENFKDVLSRRWYKDSPRAHPLFSAHTVLGYFETNSISLKNSLVSIFKSS